MSQPQETVRPEDFDMLYEIEPGRHFYQFYKDSTDYLRVIIPYFLQGLIKGQACLWIVSEKIGFEFCRTHLEASVPEFEGYLKSGQLEMKRAEEWYLENGRFHKEKALENTMHYFLSMKRRGYEILRGAGDAFRVPQEDLPSVWEYEKAVSAWIHERPVIALCAYPIFECTLSMTRSVVEAHDNVLVGHF